MHDHDAIIIGAGPAGLFCALRCAAAGLRVLVLEKNPAAGKKLLVSGSGRCNITHAGPIDDFPAHYGERARFVKPALFDFTNADLENFFAGRGVAMTETPGGKIFPASQDAHDVLGALLAECARTGAILSLGAPVKYVQAAHTGFQVAAGDAAHRSSSVVIATGGKSYPATGSTGDGYALARRLGHSIVEPEPALAPVIVRDYAFVECAGISLDQAPLALMRGGRTIREARGDVLFTHRGLSGPGVLDMSRSVLPGDTITVALAGVSASALDEALTGACAPMGRKSLKYCVSGMGVPERLAISALAASGIAPDLRMAQLDKRTRALVAERMGAFPFSIERLGGWNEAMVTRGGIPVTEIHKGSMESRLVPGLFFAGEVIDVDGDTGGYNLQFAFSSGALAAKGIVKALGR